MRLLNDQELERCGDWGSTTTRRKRLKRHGHSTITIPWRYRGADDQAGPNYTGQRAVTSYYVNT